MKAEHIKEFQDLDRELAECRRQLTIIANPDVQTNVYVIGSPTTCGDGDYGATSRNNSGFTPRSESIALRLEKSMTEERITAIQARQKELDK